MDNHDSLLVYGHKALITQYGQSVSPNYTLIKVMLSTFQDFGSLAIPPTPNANGDHM